jgi:hypothetical protein
VDEQLRKILRNVDDADPSSFLAAGNALERIGANANDFSDLLERLLLAPSAIYFRINNTFEIAWMLRGLYRRTLYFIINDGGSLGSPPTSVRLANILVSLSPDDRNFSKLLRMIVERRRLAPPTTQFLQTIRDSIVANGASSCQLLTTTYTPESFHDNRRVVYLFDVVAKINPKKDWQPDYHLRFEFVRSVSRDLLEVSIEDNLYWGSPDEVLGMRLTGSSFTLYGGEEPEYEPPGQPYTTYEVIDNIKEVPTLIAEIFDRFGGI